MAQGRLGKKTGQGFFPYPQPDADFDQKETVLLETRGEVAIIWLNRPPANPLSPQVITEFGEVWKHCNASSQIRSVVIASTNIFTFSAGADIKEFTKMDASGGAGLLDSGHAMLREMEQSSTTTIAAVNSIAFGGGCELSMACDFRLAAESATFGQPEINLGIIPGFGGTQRLPRLVGEAKALEMNLTGDAILAEEAYRLGPRPRGRARPRAARHGAQLGPQAGRAAADRDRADQDRSRTRATSTTASRPRSRASRRPSDRRTRARASARFIQKRRAKFEGKVSVESGSRGSFASPGCTVALTGAGISVPQGIPDFRSPGTGLWENVDPMEVAHIDVFVNDPRPVLVLLPAALRDAVRQAAQPRAPRARGSSRSAACSTR